MDLTKKILEVLNEATAAGNYPSDQTDTVNAGQAALPSANAVDKKWPMESEDQDDDMMVAEEDDEMSDDDEVDADEDELTEEDGDDEDEDDMDQTFSEMIARLKEADTDPEKPEGEIDTNEAVEDEDEEPVVEAKKPAKKVKESKKATKKVVKEADDNDDMPEFLKKKLDKDGDGDPDVKEDVQPGNVGETEPKDPEMKVSEAEDMSDDLSDDETALFGDDDLPEDFRKKASVVFEAAVKSRAAAVRQRVAMEATTKLQEAYSVLKTKYEARQANVEKKLAEKVDRYLTYVATEWMKENRLAVEAGIRAELAEDFISGLKKLFVEHYIEVPKSKIDVVKTMGKKMATMEAKLNEQAKEALKLRESLNRYRRDEMVRVASRGLTAVQADKLKKLSEGITYKDRDQFTTALSALKERYFNAKEAKGTPVKEEVRQIEATPKVAAPKPLNEDIAEYAKKISKMAKR